MLGTPGPPAAATAARAAMRMRSATPQGNISLPISFFAFLHELCFKDASIIFFLDALHRRIGDHAVHQRDLVCLRGSCAL